MALPARLFLNATAVRKRGVKKTLNPRFVVLEENPDLLISLSGLDYSFDLREVGEMLGIAQALRVPLRGSFKGSLGAVVVSRVLCFLLAGSCCQVARTRSPKFSGLSPGGLVLILRFPMGVWVVVDLVVVVLCHC